MIKLKTQDIQRFRPWLYVLSKNHCLMIIRKEGKEPRVVNGIEVLPIADEFSTEVDMLKEKKLSLLEEAIEGLKEEQRICITLFYLKKFSYKQVVENTGLELNAVKSHIQNGKRKLKINLEQHHEFNDASE